MTAEDRDYYARRANEEEAAARSSACPVAQSRHAELGRLYRLRLAGALATRDEREPAEPEDGEPVFLYVPDSAAA